jgi:hypothetical protein
MWMDTFDSDYRSTGFQDWSVMGTTAFTSDGVTVYPVLFIVHKDQLVRQWMIIKIRYSVCVKHIGGVCNAIEVIL